MMRLLIFLAVVGSAIATSAVTGPSKDANAVRSALESRYRHARTLKAAFFERYTDGNGGVVAESGTVYFSRPGRMRWDYQSPETKLFLIDGKSAWLYVPADRVVSRAKVGDSSDWRTPLVLLAGKADLSVFCRKIEIADTAPSGEGNPPRKLSEANSLLRCIPKSGADSADAFTAVFLEADADAYVVRITLRQPGGVETEFRFGNWEENLAIPEDKFHFQPPSGVSVVDEESLANQFR